MENNRRGAFLQMIPTNHSSINNSNNILNSMEDRYYKMKNPLTGKNLTDNFWRLLDKREKLPVSKKKGEFFELMDTKRCILLEAETGSGKTTQIPQWCVEWLQMRNPETLKGVVCCTQPRRLAAISVARRVAEEMDVKLGHEVGYSIRFEELTSYQTKLKYCTDGVLLTEFTRNQKLDEYDVIVLDEVHERTLTTDIIMGLMKKLLQDPENDIRVVVMSASVNDSGNFREFFAEFPHHFLKIAGRSYNVDILHAEWKDTTLENYVDKAVDQAIQIHGILHKNDEGDILIFLTGQDDIEEACELLQQRIADDKNLENMECLPLYGTQLPEEQEKIFMREQCQKRANGAVMNRRCIVATNIAETSMTIDGIVFVIDPGFRKRMFFDPKTRVQSLMVQRITRASAIQRAGRAGRTKSGKCFRLYTEDSFKHLLEVDPEIKHSNLANIVLDLANARIRNLSDLSLIDSPPRELVDQAVTLLFNLGATNLDGTVTSLGRKMSQLPVDPPLALTLIESVNLRCSNDVVTICAMMSANYCFTRPRKKQKEADLIKKRKFAHGHGDHLTLLNVFNKYVEADCNPNWCYENFLNANSLKFAYYVRTQLIDIMKRMHLEIFYRPNNLAYAQIYTFNILKAILAGSFMKVAYFEKISTGFTKTARGGHYIISDSINHQNVLIPHDLHRSSVLHREKLNSDKPEWVLYTEAFQQWEQKHYLKMVSVIQPEWLMELAGRYFKSIPPETELRKRLDEALNPLW